VAAAIDPRSAGHEDAFERVRPDFIVAKTSGERAVDAEGYGPAWRAIYADGDFTVLEERATGPDPVPASSPAAVRNIWDPLF